VGRVWPRHGHRGQPLNEIVRCHQDDMSRRTDITAQVTLLPVGSSPRKNAISGEWFGCPVEIDGAKYDVRFYLPSSGRVDLGSTATMEAKFLDPDMVMPLLHRGKEFTLWERGPIGHGKVIEVHGDT
jgi:hypothetical protein